MRNARRFPWWKQVVTAAGLISAFCFWLTAAAHIHSAAAQGSVRQECHLCVASETGKVFTTATPSAPAVLRTLLPAAALPEQCPVQRSQRCLPPRAPPPRS